MVAFFHSVGILLLSQICRRIGVSTYDSGSAPCFESSTDILSGPGDLFFFNCRSEFVTSSIVGGEVKIVLHWFRLLDSHG